MIHVFASNSITIHCLLYESERAPAGVEILENSIITTM